MHPNARFSRHIDHAAPTFPRKGPGEEDAEDNEGLELPVNPDQGRPLMPDEEGEIQVPA